jgi:plasmid stability protein
MPSLIVRNIDESIINALKERAARHHRSTEAEHRAVLSEALMKPARKSFAEALSSIPNVGLDTDFERLSDDITTPDVFN